MFIIRLLVHDYSNWKDILKFYGDDEARASAHEARCRRMPGWVIKDPNDDTTDKFWYATRQHTSMLQQQHAQMEAEIQIDASSDMGMLSAPFSAGHGGMAFSTGDNAAVPKAVWLNGL